MATYYSDWYSLSGVSLIKLRMKLVTSYTQSVTNNTSSVTVKQYIESKDFTEYLPGSISGKTENHKLVISGTTYTSSGVKEFTGQTTLIQTRTKTINHNSNGTGSFSVSGSCDGKIMNGQGYLIDKAMSISSKSASLPTINRVSTVTSNATNNTKFGDTINFAITRKNTSFTHDITYEMNGAKGTIATGVTTSQSWQIPISLVESTPDNAKPKINITCVTKNGSTPIGSNSYSFSCNVPDSYVPTCSLALSDVGTVPVSWGMWVKGRSILKGTITTNGSGGSTIKSFLSTVNNVILNTNPFITGTLVNNGEQTVKTVVTDSRGRTAEATQDIEITDYFLPTIVNCSVERCLEDGTLDNEGTYGKATIQYQINPINNLNDKIAKVSYGDDEKSVILNDYEGTYTFSTLFSDLEIDSSYDFGFTLKDSFEEIPVQIYSLSPSFITQSDLAGGKGITFGQTAKKEGFQVHMDSEFHKDTKVKNIKINGLKIEKYSENNWICYVEDDD